MAIFSLCLLVCLILSTTVKSSRATTKSDSTTASTTRSSTSLRPTKVWSTPNGTTVGTTPNGTTVGTTPNGTTVRTTTASTTSLPATDKCDTKTSCTTCIDNYKCYWCEPSKKCVTYPANKLVPKSCSSNKWFWKQCVIPGYALIIIIPCLGVLILLTCGCCIYCKCCRSKPSNKEEERIKRRREEMKLRNEERKRERNFRTDQIRQKYGLLKSEDEEPLI